MQLIPLQETDYGKWDDYVRSHPNGSPFHTVGWMRTIEDTFGYRNAYSFAVDENQIVGLLPVFCFTGVVTGRKTLSIPFSTYGDLLVDSEPLLSCLVQELMRTHASAKSIEIRSRKSINGDYACKLNYVTFMRDLTEKDDLLLFIPRKSRASIRHAMTYDFESRYNWDIHNFYRLYVLNKTRLGSPVYPAAFIINLKKYLGDQIGLLTVWFSGVPAASVLYIKFKQTLYAYFSGYDSKFNSCNINNLLYFNLMRYTREQGLKYFDFGRSSKGTGAAKFKENMGFEPAQLYYYDLKLPQSALKNISPTNPKMKIIAQLWQYLPVRAAKALSPSIIRRLP